MLAGRTVVALILALVATAAVGCGEERLEVSEIKSTLRELPYRYTFREDVKPPPGNSAIVVGRAFAPDGGDLDFAITLDGERMARPYPVPRTGINDYVGAANHTITSNGGSSKPGESHAAYRSRIGMQADIELALCEAATGEVCSGI